MALSRIALFRQSLLGQARIIPQKSSIRQRQRQRQRHSSVFFSTRSGEQLRVAIVGGSAAGLSSALHLAPLVEAGLVASPIDVFDAPERPFDREVGVGIWSTALNPFKTVTRESHQFVYDEMTRRGTWVGDVGYRTPNGTWLLRNHLPASAEEFQTSSAHDGTNEIMPSLLFLREMDMISTLQTAAHLEERQGTIRVHRQGNNKTRVCAIQEDSPLPWSAKLVFGTADDCNRLSDRDYHLILAADGTHSVLRQVYGGSYCGGTSSNMGIASLPSPIDLPHSGTLTTSSNTNWNKTKRQEAVGLQDRQYTVFRGNSPLTSEQLGQICSGGTKDNNGSSSAAISFQTWGERDSMRFATVPMRYPGPMQTTEERQVWFITIDKDSIAQEQDPVKRRSLLLDAFQDWHDPIRAIVEATPAHDILVERAISHSHSMGPVLNFNKVVEQLRSGRRPPSSSGDGPAILFMGDAYMTVDPILAQGFTMAMEGANALTPSVKAATSIQQSVSDMAFDPYTLRRELKERQEGRIERLICLLRATELVQALGQPHGGTLRGFLNTKVLRPLTRMAPEFVKKPIFDAVLQYSLGLKWGSKQGR